MRDSGRRDLGEELADVLGRYPVTEQGCDLVVRDPGPSNDRFAATDTRIDLDVLPWFQQGRNLPSPNAKRLQHLDEQAALIRSGQRQLPHHPFPLRLVHRSVHSTSC